MKALGKFLNLFQRTKEQRSNYDGLKSMKKWLFFGSVGSMILLTLSKYYKSSLNYAFEPNPLNQSLIKYNTAFNRSTYEPSFFMIFGVLQYIYAKYFEDSPYFKIKESQMEGGAVLEVILHDKLNNYGSKKIKKIPIALVIVGAEGLNNTALHLMQTMYNEGYRTIAIHPSDFHNQQSLDSIISEIKKRYPGENTFGIGLQYGANLLINYAANHPQVFNVLISIGNPYDLVQSQINLKESIIWRGLYSTILKGRIQAAKKNNIKIECDKLSLFQLDKLIYNLKDNEVDKFKQSNSCINSIGKLKQKTLFLQSQEDPFTIKIEGDERFQNQQCIYVSTQRGGHTQWFQNLYLTRWFTKPIKLYLRQFIGQIQKKS